MKPQSKKLLSFLTKRYSLILLTMFLFVIIFVIIFYWTIYSKIVSPVQAPEDTDFNESKLQKLIKEIQIRELKYKQSLQKKYKDLFKENES